MPALPRSRVLLLLCAWAIVPFAPVCAQTHRRPDFASHPFFKLLLGNWKSEGVLKNADGMEIKITEEWTGKVTNEGEFSIEGRRLMDNEKQEYTWTFTHNVSTGLYEAVHFVAASGGEKRRFEASISEVELTMELRMVGDGASSLTIKDSFSTPEHNELESTVLMTGSGGETNLSGKVVHRRVKKA